MKIIAFYLPQYHTIPENDKWWGKGFTEWTNLKKAKPLFEDHYQPRIPFKNNYYNLTDLNDIKWQIEIAKENGIYGFCIYHYWFNGHKLLEKPLEIILNNKDLKIPFCICWANENWTRAWVSKENKILISQKYGNCDEWEEHFNYFLNFFKDDRYITENGYPLLVIYRPEIITELNEMLDFWTELARKNGFPGIKYAYQTVQISIDDNRFSYRIEYQPNYARYDINKNNQIFLRSIKRRLVKLFNKINVNLENTHPKGLIIENYDDIWDAILSRRPSDQKSIPGAFVDWDNTPRREDRGSLILGANPEKFGYYLRKQILNAKDNYKSDMIFIFAWNEWTEGGYLEPDEKYKDGYLAEIKKALEDLDEFPHKNDKGVLS